MLEWNSRLLMMELVTSSFVCFGHYILVRLKKKPQSYVKNINWETPRRRRCWRWKKRMILIMLAMLSSSSQWKDICFGQRSSFSLSFLLHDLLFSDKRVKENELLLLLENRDNFWMHERTVLCLEQSKTLLHPKRQSPWREERRCYHQMRNLSMNDCWRREERQKSQHHENLIIHQKFLKRFFCREDDFSTHDSFHEPCKGMWVTLLVMSSVIHLFSLLEHRVCNARISLWVLCQSKGRCPYSVSSGKRRKRREERRKRREEKKKKRDKSLWHYKSSLRSSTSFSRWSEWEGEMILRDFNRDDKSFIDDKMSLVDTWQNDQVLESNS